MPALGGASVSRLLTCVQPLVFLVTLTAQEHDLTVVGGWRGRDEQEAAFTAGLSRVQWPNSRHNIWPSEGVDLAPYSATLGGIDWDDEDGFHTIARTMSRHAARYGIGIEWGFALWGWDMPHFQTVRP